MNKIIIFVSLIALTSAGISEITKNNVDLFKYSPTDIYTLPEDVDDDKPPVIFNGDVMKSKTELLENLNSGKQFKLQVKTQNGIDIQAVGKLKDSKTFVVSGQYSFTGADGKRYKTRYTADEFGYHPMTELDLEIPEPIPAAAPAAAPVSPFSASRQNSFKFLNQNLKNQDYYGRPTPAANVVSTSVQHVLPQLNAGLVGLNGGYGGADAVVESNSGYTGFNGGNLGGGLGGDLGPLRGSGQSGDDYSYGAQDAAYADHSISGYDYAPPSRQLLPAFDEISQYNVPSLI